MNDITALGEALKNLCNIYRTRVYTQNIGKVQKNSENALEDLFESILSNGGFHKLDRSDAKTYKATVQNPLTTEYERNNKGKLWYIPQPYGSQQFPDFLIGDKNFVVPVEVKSQKTEKLPVMNGHLIGLSDILVFATIKQNQIGFFRGSAIMSDELIKRLKDEREKLKNLEKNLYKDGVQRTYIRMAYNWHASVIPIYQRSDQSKLQDEVIQSLLE
jgi:hypothetical protein